MSFAFAVIPSPPITLRVLVAAIVPPPVKPVPAVIVTPEWSICSFATKFANESWSIFAWVAVDTVPVMSPKDAVPGLLKPPLAVTCVNIALDPDTITFCHFAILLFF